MSPSDHNKDFGNLFAFIDILSGFCQHSRKQKIKKLSVVTHQKMTVKTYQIRLEGDCSDFERNNLHSVYQFKYENRNHYM